MLLLARRDQLYSQKAITVIKYNTVIKRMSPGLILRSIFSKSVENFENIKDKSFLEFHLVYISVFLNFSGKKLRKLQIADSTFHLQICGNFKVIVFVFSDFFGLNFSQFGKYHSRNEKQLLVFYYRRKTFSPSSMSHGPVFSSDFSPTSKC